LRAVLQANLEPVRVDWRIEEEDWKEAIFSRMRAAGVFIAVCIPESDTRVPNSNVMYELGFAHCLQTPTVIVTSDVNTLPADIKTEVLTI